MTTLSELARRLGLSIRAASDGVDHEDPVVTDVSHDSRQVTLGSLFCCVRGDHHDGHDHAGEAVSRGAVALLCEHPVPVAVPQLITSEVRRTMSGAASIIWGNPSTRMHIIGVTGTNGKTTVVSMVTSILRSAGLRTEMIGTLTGARTTPESTDLQRLLAQFRSDGVEAVAMEVSSHALAQQRVADVDFDLALFTNLGRDHLDFHQTQEAYFAAKAKLFEAGLSHKGIVNVDDVHGRLLFDARTIPMVAVSMGDIDGYHTSSTGSEFDWRGHHVSLPMIGAHNVSNALLAATACSELGVDEETVVSGLGSLAQVPGRFEIVRTTRSRPDSPGFTAVVDYAHTPDALETTLGAAHQLAGEQGRVIVVFGCGGDRDREKRPLMGSVASVASDIAVVTSDNPRGEDPGSIIEQILEGFRDSGGGADAVAQLIVDPDRRSAIHTALSLAGDGDVVIVAGKGHERGQVIGGRVEPFDDVQVVSEYLESEGAR